MTDRIARIQAMLEQTPGDCFLNHALALEFIKAGNDVAAKKYFEKNLSADPSYVATYYHFGKLEERNGVAQHAIELYEAGMKVARAAGDNHTYSELQAAHDDLAY